MLGELGMVYSEDLNLSGIKTLDDALKRTKNGLDSVSLAKKLGLWTHASHQNTKNRESFPIKLSDLEPTALTDLYSYWTHEFGRITELCGIIAGQEQLLKIQLKSALARTRAKIRRNSPDNKLTQTQLNDMAEEDSAVLDIIEQQEVIAIINAQAGAAKEVTLQYLNTISREITFRDSQMKARVY
jgi:hypothetical protein